MFGCKHKWVEARRVHSPSVIQHLKTGGGCSEHFARELIFGVTSIELRCTLCGDVAERRLIGDHTIPLEGL